MAKNTDVQSFSIRKSTLKQLVTAYAAQMRVKSLSRFVCDLIESALLKRKNEMTGLDDQIVESPVPEKVSYKWFSSLYFNELRNYLYSGETWFEISVLGQYVHNESSEIEDIRDDLLNLYYRFWTGGHVKSPSGYFFRKMLKKARKDQNIKILAVRVRAEETHKNLGESVYKAVYAVTLVDSSKNIDSKDHFYLDYHSIQVIDVTSAGSGPIRTILRRNKKNLSADYKYWMPVTIFQNKMLVLGVKPRSRARNEIIDVTANKIIIVRPEPIKPLGRKNHELR